MTHDDDSMRRAMLAFGLACQAERDRRALAALADADRAFDAPTPARRSAEAAAARAIAVARQEPGEP